MKISQTKEARAIRALLRNKKLDQKKVWEILTSLRGEDEGSDIIKEATTALIRGRLGLKEVPHWLLAIHLQDTKVLAEKRYAMVCRHFKMHVIKAFNALNLKWYEVNE